MTTVGADAGGARQDARADVYAGATSRAAVALTPERARYSGNGGGGASPWSPPGAKATISTVRPREQR